MIINPGRFNKRIIIGKMTDGINPETGRDEGRSFYPLREVWAAIAHVRTEERFQAAAVNADKFVTFTIRCQPDMTITEDNYIKYGRKLYDIRSVSDPMELHETLVITGEAV